jgi:hypothetical protein
MAATETPVNMLDFSETAAPLDNPREEEAYMYRYFQTRGPKPGAKKSGLEDEDGEIEDGDEGEDKELEAFANDVIKKEMKKMNAGVDALEDEDDEVLSQLEDQEKEDEDEEAEDEDDFFGGEGDMLEEVDVEGEGAEEGEDSEQEMGSEEIQELEADDDDNEEEDGDYGMEDDEEEEEDNVFSKKPSKGSKKDKPKKQSIFADYEEFAHLLEGDMYEGGAENGSKASKKHKFGGE